MNELLNVSDIHHFLCKSEEDYVTTQETEKSGSSSDEESESTSDDQLASESCHSICCQKSHSLNLYPTQDSKAIQNTRVQFRQIFRQFCTNWYKTYPWLVLVI